MPDITNQVTVYNKKHDGRSKSYICQHTKSAQSNIHLENDSASSDLNNNRPAYIGAERSTRPAATSICTRLRRFVVGLSLQRPGFESRPVNEGIMVEKAALGYIFFE